MLATAAIEALNIMEEDPGKHTPTHRPSIQALLPQPIFQLCLLNNAHKNCLNAQEYQKGEAVSRLMRVFVNHQITGFSPLHNFELERLQTERTTIFLI